HEHVTNFFSAASSEHDRGVVVNGYESGNFLGPTVLGGNLGPGVPAYDSEVFGPVLCVLTAETLHEAIQLVNSCRYGNGKGFCWLPFDLVLHLLIGLCGMRRSLVVPV
ncbi:unnamed protein product, partial [Hapterophycus canaliculatus]